MTTGVAEDALILAIESSLQVYPPVSGLSEDLGIKGVRGRITDLSNPLANLVGMANIPPDEVDADLKMVRNRYSRGRKGTAGSPVRSRGRRTSASGSSRAGSRRHDEMAGMALTDLAVPIAVDPKIEVREATLHEAQAASAMMARAYGIPEEVARFFNVLLAMTDSKVRNRGYFAYVDGGTEPVGWSYLVYLPDSPIVLLGGAATLPEHRGRGIYSALVAKRLADARADGRAAAVIQAVRSTSAPIAAKLGFREICGTRLLRLGRRAASGDPDAADSRTTEQCGSRTPVARGATRAGRRRSRSRRAGPRTRSTMSVKSGLPASPLVMMRMPWNVGNAAQREVDASGTGRPATNAGPMTGSSTTLDHV